MVGRRRNERPGEPRSARARGILSYRRTRSQASAFSPARRTGGAALALSGSSLSWDNEAFSTVNVSMDQLDDAFMSANGAALEAKLSKFSGPDRKKLLDDLGQVGVLNTDDKKLDAIINPPAPKEK